MKTTDADVFRIAQIVRPHGVTGALKLLPLTDDVRRFKALSEAYLEQGSLSYLPVTASEISVQPDAVFLRLSCCDSREAAEKLRGKYLCVDRAHAAKLPQGRWFIKDLIGCAVSDTEGKSYGVLHDVMETGANDVYVIKGEKELLIPALKKLLVEVDTENKRVLLDADVLREVGLFAD